MSVLAGIPPDFSPQVTNEKELQIKQIRLRTISKHLGTCETFCYPWHYGLLRPVCATIDYVSLYLLICYHDSGAYEIEEERERERERDECE